MPATLHTALTRLNEIGARINRIGSDEALPLRDTLSLIAESCTQFVPHSIALITTYHPPSATFDDGMRVSAGGADLIEHIRPRQGGMGHTAITERRRVVSYEGQGPDMHPRLTAAGVRAAVCFPLIVADEVVGALYIYIQEARRFDEAELLMLGSVANLAAMAITHTRRIDSTRAELDRREEQIAQLRQAGLLISSRMGLNATLEAILEMAMAITGAQYGIFRLVGPGTLDTAAYAGLGQPIIESLPVDESSIMGWVAVNAEPLLIADLTEEPWRSRYKPLDQTLAMRSEVAVPLIGSRVEGVLNLESPHPRAFNERDSLLLQGLATQAVIAIQEARLLDALQNATDWLLTRPLDAMLQGLADLTRDLLDADAAHLHLWKPDITHTAGGPMTGEAVGVPLLSEGTSLGALNVYGAPGDAERNAKVMALLAHYAVLALQNAERQTELRTAHAQRTLAETFAAMGDVAANLLHQLNNKIGIIPVRVEGIQLKRAATLAADDYLATNLTEIGTSAREAMTIVRENVALLRPLTIGPTDIAACVTEAIRETQPPAGITLKREGLADLPPVEGSQQSVMLVFANLIDNATRAMGGTGRMTISGWIGPDRVRVTVCDDGPGVPADLRDHIFELNVSGGQAGKLGFGLWWVKTLMTRLGGTITLMHDHGGGACFRLTFPRSDV